MTSDASLFQECYPCLKDYKVRIADGSLSLVIGIGKVVISNTLTLQSVLLVPKLTCNLLSVSKLTKDSKCIAKFSPTTCLFQDLDSGKMISNAKEDQGVY